MKNKIYILIALVHVFAFGQAAVAQPVYKNYAKQVLSLVDVACGDTWCEGDFNFVFTHFSCNFVEGVCNLSFLANEHGLAEQVRGDCNLRGYYKESDLLDSEDVSGRMLSRLTHSLNNDITECLDGFENLYSN